MRTLIQRVRSAAVSIDSEIHSSIGEGLLIFLGIEEADTVEDIDWLCGKISRLRIFKDPGGIMNLSVMDTGGDALVISQFTLHASTRKGNRPSYIRAAAPATAIPLYEQFIARLGDSLGKKVNTGKFGAYMQVSLVNDGPVTILIDSKSRE